mmetsp:Transcript_14703/g.22863  ORF Transcript_14703/g.22863 Transcript_14703/m.22863 type:complete len:103 (+) Transcript_14703:1051-1359(+)
MTIQVTESIIYLLGSPLDIAEYVEERRKRGEGTAILSPLFLTYLMSNFFGDYHGYTKLSTGIVSVLWALHTCSSVTTYGFGGGSSSLEGTQFRFESSPFVIT